MISYLNDLIPVKDKDSYLDYLFQFKLLNFKLKIIKIKILTLNYGKNI